MTIGISGWIKSYYTWALQNGLPEQFFAVSSENTDFPKKLFNMKIFSSKFVIKKDYINFWCKITPFPKKCSCPPKMF